MYVTFKRGPMISTKIWAGACDEVARSNEIRTFAIRGINLGYASINGHTFFDLKDIVLENLLHSLSPKLKLSFKS